MIDRKIFKTEIGGRVVSFETGAYCEQSGGACIVRCGETTVMVNVCMANEPREGIDFFPLNVDFEEKMYSVGKIPGGFKKREGRPSDKAILTSRLIDRPLRPLFPKGFYNDVVLTATCLSVDGNIPPEVYAMLGSSFALSISNIPLMEATGSVVVGLVDGQYVINPDSAQRDISRLNLTLSGTKDAIMMVEAGAYEVSEEEMIGAILFGHEEIKRIVDFIDGVKAEIGKEKIVPIIPKPDEAVTNDVKAFADKKMDVVLNEYNRQLRQAKEDALDKEIFDFFKAKYPDNKKDIAEILYSMKKSKVRAKILNEKIRPDGRSFTEIRPIWCEVGVLDRTHGSGVFTRGQTQVLNITTLGTISEVQKLEGLDDEMFKRYIHHYNFPPYSVGEAKSMRSTGRREIGHGALAERALEPVLPSEEAFPYAIRTVSEVLSSNGSTSQASVCGSTLSLMDAGVPIKAPVAGIAMGLVSADDKSSIAILSDIQGLEDFLGDMDFKVAGTKEGITAIQMDIKIKGINEEILRNALEQARVGRLAILDKMLETISVPRTKLNKYAPKVISFSIDTDKIKVVIGSGGKTINKIIEDTGVKIDISNEGTVFISTADDVMAEKAKAIILNLVRDPEVGDQYEGTVTRIMDFGAFVEIAPGKEGMVHISKLSKERVEKVTDIINLSDKVLVEIIAGKDRTKIDMRLLKKL